MKAIIIFSIFIMAYYTGFSQQNLIPNGGFDLNPGNYHGGINPVGYYSGHENCILGLQRFEDDITDWFVAETNAPSNHLQFPGTRKCSPDWVAPGTTDYGSECNVPHTSFFVASAYNAESIMNKMVKSGSEYFLEKGKTYKFRAKVRTGKGVGSFQVVFSTDEKGLNVSPSKRWVAVDVYVDFSGCEWRNIEYYFTVPTDNDKKYDEMKYIVLQYNHEINNNTYTIHYDDVALVEEQPCIDLKYIQNWSYYDLHKIEQANQKIFAGQNVQPGGYQGVGPVIVKSNAMVIYRAPEIYLEPGFFVEEPGSYFETEIGTCVPDPCPSIPAFTAPTTAFCGPTTLGTSFPNTPGILYVWEPAEYFSTPWSRTTDFTPPAGTGCVDAKLTIWTICGASQTFNFPIRYYDAAPQVSITNLQTTPTQISFKATYQNTQSYTLVVTHVNSGTILYQETVNPDCGNNSGFRNFKIGACDFNMCGNKQIKIIANNACYPSVEQSFTVQSPPAVLPVVSVSNLVSSDYAYGFDVAVNTNTEYVTVEIWNAELTAVICTNTYRSCDFSGQTSLHWNNLKCTTNLSVCTSYKIKIKQKNICGDDIATQTLNWNKSTTAITVGDYPNVITANGDGINDELCMNVTGADYYTITVVDRWGVPRFSGGGPITSNPVCMWEPAMNMPEDVYYYTVTFTSACASAVQNTAFLHLFNETAGKNLIVGAQHEEEEVIKRSNDLDGIQIYPNPVTDYLYVSSSDKITQIVVMDIHGKVVVDTFRDNKVNCSSLSPGAYFVKVKTENASEQIKFIKI